MMGTEEESKCCQEMLKVVEKIDRYNNWNSDQVAVRCITEVPGFSAVCLDKDVLETAYFQYKQEVDTQKSKAHRDFIKTTPQHKYDIFIISFFCRSSVRDFSHIFFNIYFIFFTTCKSSNLSRIF